MFDQNPEARNPAAASPVNDNARLEAFSKLLADKTQPIRVELEGATIELSKLETGGYRITKIQSPGQTETFVYDTTGAFEFSHAYYNHAYGRLAGIWSDEEPPDPDRTIGDLLLQKLSGHQSALPASTTDLETHSLPKPPKPTKSTDPEPKHSTSWAQVSRLLQFSSEEENLLREKLKPTESHAQLWVENSVLLDHLGLNTDSPELNTLKALALYNFSNQSARATNGDEVLSAWVTLIATEKDRFPTALIEKQNAELKSKIENNDFPGISAGEKARGRSNCLLQTMLLERVLNLREQHLSSPLSPLRKIKLNPA